MKAADRKLLEGFLEYLQGIYGEQGAADGPGFAAPNGLTMPEFAAPEKEPDYQAAAGALRLGPTTEALLAAGGVSAFPGASPAAAGFPGETPAPPMIPGLM